MRCMHTGYVNGDVFEGIIVNYVVFWVIGFKEYLYGLIQFDRWAMLSFM